MKRLCGKGTKRVTVTRQEDLLRLFDGLLDEEAMIRVYLKETVDVKAVYEPISYIEIHRK